MSAGADPLDRFIPEPDVRQRFEIAIGAPARLVKAEAVDFDMQAPPLARAVLRLREKLMGASPSGPRQPQGLLAETMSLRWGPMDEQPDRLVVCGAACQPGFAGVKFTPIAPERFADYAESEQVKFAWTLDAEPLAPASTRSTQETRVLATDAVEREKFHRYRRWARFGIIGIRLLLLPAMRQAAERRWTNERKGR